MKAVVVLADGFEEVEAVLRRGGVTVVLAGLASLQVTGARGVGFHCDTTLDQVSPDWDVLVLPGGMPGSKNLAGSNLVAAAIDEGLARGAKVAAICAAPALVLGPRGLLQGRDFTCYPGNESSVVGGRYREDAVVVDGPFVTSRGAATAAQFSLKILEILSGKEKATAVAKAVLAL
jgi:4-methyl-5(b-hydroxyethyl)-thiazole monophosphate biosynthesis